MHPRRRRSSTTPRARCSRPTRSAPTADAADIDAGDLADGMAMWTTIDSPWITHTDRNAFERTLWTMRSLAPTRVLGSHLPAAFGMADRLIDILATVPGSVPWVGPDQTALDQMLATVTA